jgi:hypothetical protein
MVIALLCAGVAGLACYAAGMHSRLAPRSGGLSILPRELDKCRQTDAELERRCQVFMRRGAAKDQAVRAMLAGRLTLGQAAARFRAIEREQPVTQCPARAANGPEDGERLCRDIIDRARHWVAENLPAEAASVAARLEAELEQLRRLDGAIRLPE